MRQSDTSTEALVEREAELAHLTSRMADARLGQGGLVLIEAAAGQGKTSLLRALRESVGDDVRVLRATGAELERDFPFGIVRQLLEAELRGADGERRARLLQGTAVHAAPVFDAAIDERSSSDISHVRLHGLFWLLAGLAEEQPLLLLVDDAHWADAPSLRFLDVLGRRIEDLPVLAVVAARPAEPGAAQDILDGLAAGAAASVVRLDPLSPAAVRALIRERIGDAAEDAFIDACIETTKGSPLLVTALARLLAEQGVAGRADEAEIARRTIPGSITRAVGRRLRELSPAALGIARSIAVLGDRSRLALAAELAGSPLEEALEAHAALVRARLIEADGLTFVHPMVREAVRADLVGGERSAWHRRAARLLAAHDARDDEIALHLLLTEPENDAAAARTLAAAGSKALADGAPDVAVRHLRRALLEPPAASERAAVLLAAGIAEVRTGGGEAGTHLQRAVEDGDALIAGRAAQVLCSVLILRGDAERATATLRAPIEAVREVSPEFAARLEEDLLDALPYDEENLAEYHARLRDVPVDAPDVVLSHHMWVRASAGAHRDEVIELGRRAFAGDLAAAIAQERFAPFYGIEALHLVEAADEAATILAQAAVAVRRSGSRVAAATLTWMQSSWERRFGDLRRAEDEARRGWELLEHIGGSAGLVMSSTTLAGALIDQGRLDEAEAVVATLPATETSAHTQVGIHAARARLWFERGRYADALEEIDTQLVIDERSGRIVADREPYRTIRVAALAHAGRTDEALALARDEVDVACRRAVAGAEAVARLARGRLLDGPAALEELEAAVAAARRSPCRYVLAESLGAFGAALRRANHRADARAPLREARELAHRCGARGLEQQIHAELVVAGARPQRISLAGVDALTAAERRVAELAARGMRNREIAETLFVTLKTVEVHLGRAYGKLDIRSRSQLADALGLAEARASAAASAPA
ncbi:MAG: AAA family ATPase [Solirubrobacteraceae bacterium]|nr:AAA family ATPase [Solirubrobacteraceae bacterium]